MNITREGASAKSTPHHGSSLATQTGAKPSFLGIDRIVENLSAVLTRTGARKVEASVLDRRVRLVVDEEGMDEAFAKLGNAVARGAKVLILGGLVRIETGEDGGRGCALLSVSVAGGQEAVKTEVRDALSAVRDVIKKHSGFLRFWEGRGEMRLNLYLPVLHGP